MTTAKENSLSSSRVCGPPSASTDLLECSICQELLWKPVACQFCETPFCIACINKWLASNPNKCPNRCESYIERKCPPIIAKLLSQLQISCCNREHGCQEVVAYEALEKHEAECTYQTQLCPGCRSQILKKDFTEHESTCDFIQLTCEDCALVYKRNEANAIHTENICLRAQLRRFREELKKNKLEMQELSRQLSEIRSWNPISPTITLNFADLPSAEDKSINIPMRYKGLRWTTIAYMHRSFATKKYAKTGYASAFTKDGSVHVAFFKDKATIGTALPTESFTLLSLDACGAWRIDLQLTIKGYRNATVTATHTATLIFGKPQPIQLQWNNIDKITLESSGGTPNPDCPQSASPHVILTRLVIKQ